MPIQSCGQSVSARRGKLYTETGLFKRVESSVHSARIQRLKLSDDEPLSEFAFNFSLRRYRKGGKRKAISGRARQRKRAKTHAVGGGDKEGGDDDDDNDAAPKKSKESKKSKVGTDG